MAISIAGKTAIVTGAGRGIGRGIAQVFAADGAKVLVVNRSMSAGEDVVREIRDAGGEATFLRADVMGKGDHQRMVDAAVETYGCAVEPGTIATQGLLGLGQGYVRQVSRSIPMGSLGTPEDIAYALLFFASDQARYMTGQCLTVDGGQILPESPEALAAAIA